MSSWLNELYDAVRVLLKYRTFSVLAISILAIAIGANTAIFSLVHAVLLDPLPYPEHQESICLKAAAMPR
jgi:putative ABC transport system permease protein